MHISRRGCFVFDVERNSILIKLSKLGVSLKVYVSVKKICNSYTMGCPPVRGDNP